jgi:3-dehydroquinate dehydratase type I
MESFRLSEIIQATSKPVIITYRSKKEGGNGAIDYEQQTGYLLRAVEADADFVDVEYSMPAEFRRRIFHSRGRSKIIVSSHFLNGTPPREELENIFRRMAATGADSVKIVTQANAPEDNLRVLELIPPAKRQGVNITAFCMGQTGRISRVLSHLMGSCLTFASLEKGQECADGQIPVREMKKILEFFSL